MTAEDQMWAKQFMPVKMVETGHIAVTVKESILEKAFELGEKFVAQCKSFQRSSIPQAKASSGRLRCRERWSRRTAKKISSSSMYPLGFRVLRERLRLRTHAISMAKACLSVNVLVWN